MTPIIICLPTHSPKMAFDNITSNLHIGHVLALLTLDCSAALDTAVHSFLSRAVFSGFLTAHSPVFPLFFNFQACNLSLSEHSSGPSSSVYLHSSIILPAPLAFNPIYMLITSKCVSSAQTHLRIDLCIQLSS